MERRQSLDFDICACPMADLFPYYYLFFLISVIFRWTREAEVGPKVQTLGLSHFHENLNPSKSFQRMLLFARVLPLVRISAKCDQIWGSKYPKTFQKALLHKCSIGTKTLKIYNLIIPNVILMKLTTIMYK